MWWPGILHFRQVSGDLNGAGVWLTPDMRVFILVLNYCVGSEKHKMQTPTRSSAAVILGCSLGVCVSNRFPGGECKADCGVGSRE